MSFSVLNQAKVFSSFTVRDLDEARAFYSETLKIDTKNWPEMGFELIFTDGNRHFVYQKKNHRAADFTVLNFIVENIDVALEDLKSKSITPQYYNDPDLPQDEKGVVRGLATGHGPDIAWIKDPSGNILSILQPE